LILDVVSAYAKTAGLLPNDRLFAVKINGKMVPVNQMKWVQLITYLRGTPETVGEKVELLIERNGVQLANPFDVKRVFHWWNMQGGQPPPGCPNINGELQSTFAYPAASKTFLRIMPVGECPI
jgi:hypothetical protein